MDLIELPADDGAAEACLARPESGSGPGVLLFMDAIGLRPRIQEMCDRIAGWGYVVLAPNVFYRDGTVAEIAPRVDLREPGAREEFFAGAMPRVHGLTPDLSVPDIAAFVEHLRGLGGVAEGSIGTVGYCMGARLAVRAATSHPALVAACAGFHGGGLVTDEQDSPHAGLASARAEFVFGHADQDPSMPPEAVAALGEALGAHGLTASNEVYPGAPHGYTMSDTSAYDEAATERHFSELQALLARVLPT
ncbi:dienelactone hydrolase family protein [Nocardioides sp. 503]|uniref:dienelactone hydrolase family protein n=1 Tax=Nocardioides sp. 503 TaxID=2508326 RepID=UPI00107052F1|nr:dienelactone hydrolase family protein [Nocardioides sp. 503]